MKHKFLFSVFIIFFILVFIALGIWQIIRLNWKNNLILEIENSLKNPPVELTQSNKENYLKMNLEVYLELTKMFKNFIFNFEGPDLNTLDGRLWSMAYRIDHWLIFYKQFFHNTFTIVFGAGSTFIYYESTIFRILFGTGIFGLLFVIYSIKNISLHILFLLIVSGLSLDLLLSFKIFFTLLLYFYIENKIKYDYRN